MCSRANPTGSPCERADDPSRRFRFDEIVTPDGEILTKLPGQHQLLGWGLEPADLAFLVRIGASLDCDEYGS